MTLQKQKREEKVKQAEKIHLQDLEIAEKNNELWAKKLEIAEKTNALRAKKEKLRHLETKVLHIIVIS